jgi:SAM-dependent methyltransferase|nr:MAG TPA: Nodulation protein S (NodS) [Caudoviricetes sp.]
MKDILDACCGTRMMWFQKRHQDVLYADYRRETLTCCDGRTIVVDPDVDADFTNMPWEDDAFAMVVFDPPHLKSVGKTAYMRQKYGALDGDWKETIRNGFSECFRVLKPGGFLIFKWADVQIALRDVLPLAGKEAMFGSRVGGKGNGIFLVFRKEELICQQD